MIGGTAVADPFQRQSSYPASVAVQQLDQEAAAVDAATVEPGTGW